MKLFLRCLLMGLLSPLAMAEMADDVDTGDAGNSAVVRSFLESIKSSGISEKDQTKLGCKLQVLDEMGWELQSNSSLNSLTTLGSSVIGVPESILDVSDIESTLNQALVSDTTFDEYKKRLKKAGERAAKNLYVNKGFGFRKPGDPVCTFNATGDWENDYDLIRPSGSRCAAIQALYSKATKCECSVGLHAVQLASQYELYGCEDFEHAFSPEELTVSGNWTSVMNSENIIYGTKSQKFGTFYENYDSNKHSESLSDQFDPGAKQTADKGPLALTGLSGYIGYKDERDRAHLDDLSNKGQNFMILETSVAGAQALAARGTDGYDEPLEEAYKRMLKIFYKTNPDGSVYYEEYTTSQGEKVRELKKRYIDSITKNWLVDAIDVTTRWLEDSKQGTNIPALPVKLEPTPEIERMSRVLTEVMMILNDPFLRDTMVFVHPHEKMSLGHYVIYQLLENPRVAPGIVIYGSTVNTLLFTRLLEYKIEQCIATPKTQIQTTSPQ